MTHPIRAIPAAVLAAAVISGAAGTPGAQLADDRAAGTDTTLYRVSAAHLRSTLEDGERVAYLTGGVTIIHQTATITSGSGRQYPDRNYTVLLDGVHGIDGTLEMFGDIGEYFSNTNTLVMVGNVRMLDKGWVMLCDRVEYDRRARVAILTGNLRLADSTRVMYADSIFYDRNAEVADAFGSVVLIDETEDYSIAGDHVRFDRNRKEAVVDERPILTFDMRAVEQGRITSRWMHFDVDRQIGTALGDVNMIKGDTRAHCDSAVIHEDEGLIELRGSPRATNGPSGMTGRRMDIHYDDEGVKRIIIPDSGRLTEKPGGGSPWRKDSWIVGDSIAIFLSDEKVDSVRILGCSKAMYYPIEGEENKVSNNFSSGDTMFFRFRNEDLSYVRISGSAAGIYNYLNLVPGETIDSLAAAIDSSLTFREFGREAQTVRYSARVIEYFAASEDLILRGNSSIKHQNMSLGAGNIDFNSRLHILEATGEPVLDEDGQKMYGYTMGYDMDSEAGLVSEGSTKYEQGYYLGENIFKVRNDVLKVYNSTYTTCDNKRPHYSFRANKMRVYVRDKIVSGPITLYIGEMPVFYLPFMAQSLRRDRHSGILKPNFDIGIDSREGRFIRGLGYYWATNDYTDFTVRTDFNENSSFRINMENRYKVRYRLSGKINFNFYRNLRSYTSEWTVKSTHNQTFGQSASLSSSLRFVSSDKAQSAMNQARDVQDYVDRRIYSSATFRKSWGGTRLNLSATRNQKLNLSSPTEARVSATMPSFSLSFPRTSLWLGEKHGDGERSIWERALGQIMFTPKISATRKTEESEAREKETLSATTGAGFSQQHKILLFNFRPSMNMKWDYFRVLHDRIDTMYTDQLSRDTRYTNEVSMNLSSSLGTTVYGIFYPRIGPLRGIRHTLNPEVTYSYRPKLTDKQTENRSVSYSIRNALDLKVRKDTTEVKKPNVITWNLSGSYDPDLPKERRWSMISSRINTSAGGIVSLRINQTYDPYERKITRTSISTGINLRLRGGFTYPGKWGRGESEKIAAAAGEPIVEEEVIIDSRYRDGIDDESGAPEDEHGPGPSGSRQGWTLNVDYALTHSRQGDFQNADSQLRLNGSIQLTKNWKVTYNSFYNIEDREFTSQTYSLRRDLHCWQASFVHRRFGLECSYYLQIAIKAHPEIMYERGPRGIQTLGGY